MSEQTKIRNVENGHRLQDAQREMIEAISEIELRYLAELRDAGFRDDAAQLALEGVFNRIAWRDLINQLDERAELAGFGEPKQPA